MKTKLAFDMSGLAWRYRTGVQNLYWSFADAYTANSQDYNNFDILFYDRSGLFNDVLNNKLHKSYKSTAPKWWPSYLRRPLQVLNQSTNILMPNLSGRINHVWNWNIYAPANTIGSITIPDLIPIEYPEWFSEKFKRVTKLSIDFAEKKAEYVFVISKDVKNRIIDSTKINPEKIRVIYPGIDPKYYIEYTSIKSEKVFKKYNLEPGKYFISSGFIDPRKNLIRQLSAFCIAIKSKKLNHYKYVITGLKNNLSSEIMELINSQKIGSRIVFLGYVPKEELIILTGGSTAVMYCSLAEGFGLPIIEAMAAGAAVITSSCSSMYELANGRAEIVDPYRIEEIVNAINRVIEMPEDQKKKMSLENRIYSKKFTIKNWWEGHLQAFDNKPYKDLWKD